MEKRLWWKHQDSEYYCYYMPSIPWSKTYLMGKNLHTGKTNSEMPPSLILWTILKSVSVKQGGIWSLGRKKPIENTPDTDRSTTYGVDVLEGQSIFLTKMNCYVEYKAQLHFTGRRSSIIDIFIRVTIWWNMWRRPWGQGYRIIETLLDRCRILEEGAEFQVQIRSSLKHQTSTSTWIWLCTYLWTDFPRTPTLRIYHRPQELKEGRIWNGSNG